MIRPWVTGGLSALVAMSAHGEEGAAAGAQAALEAVTDRLQPVPLKPIPASPAFAAPAQEVLLQSSPDLATPLPAFQPATQLAPTATTGGERAVYEADDLGVWILPVAMVVLCAVLCAVLFPFMLRSQRRRIARSELSAEDGFMSNNPDDAVRVYEQPVADIPPKTLSGDGEKGGGGLPDETVAVPPVGMSVAQQAVEAVAAPEVGPANVENLDQAKTIAPATTDPVPLASAPTAPIPAAPIPAAPVPATPAGDSIQPQVAGRGDFGPSTVDVIRDTRTADSHQSWRSFNRDSVPQLLFYGGNKFNQFSTDRMKAADEWFIIGDIHGDFFALHTIISFIRRTCPGFGIIFLGDLIDRGPHPIECLWYLLKLADDHPNRVLWLAGNHDVGVRFDAQTGRFRSTVEPAEFVSELNLSDSVAPLRRGFGLEYIELSQGLPRAAVMPDGLLLTHGGFPHTDLQAEFSEMKIMTERLGWLESEPVIRDFTHLRITKYPLRRPNRLSIACSYGYRDFEAFRQVMTEYNVKRLVTGHQHAEGGYDDHPDWAKNGSEALTLTGFGFADAYDRPESYASHYRRNLITARCRANQLPEVISIPVDQTDLKHFFDEEIVKMPRFATP